MTKIAKIRKILDFKTAEKQKRAVAEIKVSKFWFGNGCFRPTHRKIVRIMIAFAVNKTKSRTQDMLDMISNSRTVRFPIDSGRNNRTIKLSIATCDC